MWTSRRPRSSRQPRPFVRPARAHHETHGTKTRRAHAHGPPTRGGRAQRLAPNGDRSRPRWAVRVENASVRPLRARDRRVLERSRSRWVEPPTLGTVHGLVASTQPKHGPFKIGVVQTTRKMNGSCFRWFEPPKTRTVHVSGSSNHQKDERFMFSVRRRNESSDRSSLPHASINEGKDEPCGTSAAAVVANIRSPSTRTSLPAGRKRSGGAVARRSPRRRRRARAATTAHAPSSFASDLLSAVSGGGRVPRGAVWERLHQRSVEEGCQAVASAAAVDAADAAASCIAHAAAPRVRRSPVWVMRDVRRLR